MFFMVTMTYPTKSSVQVGKVAVGTLAKAPPPHVERLGIYTAAGGDGFKAYSLYEVEGEHVEEGIRELTKRFVPFYSVEGWKYTLEPLMGVEESLATIGL